MFNEIVAQKPTVPFRAGTRNFKKSEKLTKRDGADKHGTEPARRAISPGQQQETDRQQNRRADPLQALMYSMPLRITARLMSQKARKQMPAPWATWLQAGNQRGDQRVDGFAANPGLNAEPSAGHQGTQNCGDIRAQHSERSACQDGERIPNARRDASSRASEENDGIAKNTVATACFQFIPPWIRLAASM